MQREPVHEPEFARGLVFIPQTGTPIKDPIARRILKQQVTQHASKYRRKRGLIRRQSSLQCTLEVFNNFAEQAAATKCLPPSCIAKDNLEDDPKQVDSDNTQRTITQVVTRSRCCNAATSRIADYTTLSSDRVAITSVDPFARYPFALNRGAQELMHIVHVSNNGPVAPFKVVAFRLIWVEISRNNPASFHQYIAGAQAYFDFLRKGEDSPLVIAHRTRALHLTNAQLTDAKTASSDGILASLVLLARYDQMHGNFDKWRMHLNGIKELIHLRGDIDEIGMDEFLRYMLSNSDIAGSFALDAHPDLPHPAKALSKAWPRSSSITIEPCIQCFVDLWATELPKCAELVQLITDIIPEKRHLQNEIVLTRNRIWTETLYIWHFINPLLHRLLCIPRNSPSSPSSLMAEALRLGLIVYLATIRYSFGISPFQSGAPTRKIKALFTEYEHFSTQETLQSLGWGWIKIWVLGCAALNRPSGPESNWYLDQLHFEMSKLGLQTYDEFEECVGFFLWIPEVHGVLLRDGCTRSL